jgi:hypothetical protein
MTGAPDIESSENANTGSQPYRTTETSQLRGMEVRTWSECMGEHSNRQRISLAQPRAIYRFAHRAKSLCRIFVSPFELKEVLLDLSLV